MISPDPTSSSDRTSAAGQRAAVTLGLVAGNGVLPGIIAQRVNQRTPGNPEQQIATSVVIVGHRGETNPDLLSAARASKWVKVGQLGKIIAFFRAHGVSQVVFAGGIGRPSLFRGFWPDLTAFAVMRRAGGIQDDKLLRETAREFERNGMTVLSPQAVLPELLTPLGFSVGVFSEAQKVNARLGWQAAAALGQLDVGQTAVVQRGLVVALEGIEGTDACIRRGAELAGPGFMVVKRAKPQQDQRLDLPTIGAATIDILVAAKAGGLVIHAGSSLLLNPIEVEQRARAAGLCIRAISDLADLQ